MAYESSIRLRAVPADSGYGAWVTSKLAFYYQLKKALVAEFAELVEFDEDDTEDSFAAAQGAALDWLEKSWPVVRSYL